MINYSTDTVRSIILGKTTCRKCPMCEGSALQNWNEDGLDVKSGAGKWPERMTGECDNCNGLGFILVTYVDQNA